MRVELQAVFLQQARACTNLGSPFNALLCQLLAERLTRASRFGARIDDWSGPAVADALALRCTGALHALARSGRVPALSAAYPPRPLASPDALWAAVEQAIVEQDAFLHDYLDSPPQTNEVARSSAWLGAALRLGARTGLALHWHEIGASAGLNLAFDRYRYELDVGHYGAACAKVLIRSRWEGDTPALTTPVRIATRQGCDVQPLRASSAEDRERLLSYIWPDQSERLARTAAALDQAAHERPALDHAPASTWIAARFVPPLQEGTVRVIAHSIVWQYLPASERAAVAAAVHEAGARATTRARVAWLSMEADQASGDGQGAALELTSWPGGERELLGRADFHGRWVRWAAAPSAGDEPRGH